MKRLELHEVNKRFGSLHVTRDVSFTLDGGERAALIGPNGAGKTTLVNLISGALPLSAGKVLFEGHDVSRMTVPQRARRGLVRTFQISRLFEGLTVDENLRVAALHCVAQAGESCTADELVEDGLSMLDLQHLRGKLIESLSLGERRLVELSLALLLRPKLLLLDEPAAGIPRSESHMVLSVVNDLPKDLAVLLIEHDMDLVFSWARRVIVLAGGAVLLDAHPDVVANDDHVQRIYFGRGDAS